MANRYWVGGTSSWNNTAGSKWALISGGAGGQAVPTVSDDVFFDSNSGTVTVTFADVNPEIVCNNLDFTGFTGTIDFLNIIKRINGSLTLSSTMTLINMGTLQFRATSTGKTITTNGKTVSQLSFTGIGGGWTLQDNINTGNGGISLTNGSLIFNNINWTGTNFDSSGTSIRSVNLGSGTISLSGGASFPWDISTSSGISFNAGTSIIKYTISAVSVRTFAGGGLTYNNLWITGSGTGTFRITGSNTFNEFKCDTPPHTIHFTAGTNNKFSSWVVSGTSGNIMTIASITTAPHTLTLLNGRAISDYLSVTNSIAIPSINIWYAGSHSTDGGGNSGWIFADYSAINVVDGNNVRVLTATSNINGSTPVNVKVNSTNHALLANDNTTGSDLSGDNASRDDNGNPVIMAVSSADGVTPVAVYADPSTGRLLIKST